VPAELRGRPFTVAEANSLGVSRTMLEGVRFRTLLRGVHICADVALSLPVWLEAAFLLLPDDATVVSVTGLHARGVNVGQPWPLRLATTADRRARHPRLRLARVHTVPTGVGRVASAAHCFASACAELDLVDAVTAGDWLVHRRLASLEELVQYAGEYTGAGAARARRAAGHVRERVESPRETYVRLLLVLAGLPEPECNPNLGTAACFLGRGDLVYMAYGLLVEYDGRQHADDAVQWNRDLDRLDDFEDARWGHVRVTAKRLERPREVVRRVHAKLVARGYRGPAPVFGPQWVALFETRSARQRAHAAPTAASWSLSGQFDVTAARHADVELTNALRAGTRPR
jgi:hypothetical protein